MRTKKTFDVKKDKDEIVVTHVLEQRFSPAESVVELNKLRQELQGYNKQVVELRDKLENNTFEEQLEQMEAQQDNLESLEVKWKKISEVEEKKLRTLINKKVQKLRADKRYSSVDEKNKPMVRHNILSIVSTELGLAQNHPLVNEARMKWKD